MHVLRGAGVPEAVPERGQETDDGIEEMIWHKTFVFDRCTWTIWPEDLDYMSVPNPFVPEINEGSKYQCTEVPEEWLEDNFKTMHLSFCRKHSKQYREVHRGRVEFTILSRGEAMMRVALE